MYVNIGSGNGLFPDAAKPLPEPVLIYHQWGSVAFPSWQYHRNISRYRINSLRAKFFSRNINMVLQFLLFLRVDLTQVVEIVSHGTHFKKLISWVLMTWRHKEPGHQHP